MIYLLKNADVYEMQGVSVCKVYAILSETAEPDQKVPPSSTTICGGNRRRESQVYTSQSNQVEVQITSGQDINDYFLFKYKGNLLQARNTFL